MKDTGLVAAHLTDVLKLSQAMGIRLVALVREGVVSPGDPLCVQWDIMTDSMVDLVTALKEAARADV